MCNSKPFGYVFLFLFFSYKYSLSDVEIYTLRQLSKSKREQKQIGRQFMNFIQTSNDFHGESLTEPT